MIPPLKTERAALVALARRAQAYIAPDAEADLQRHGQHGAARLASGLPTWDANDQGPAVCLLFRGALLLPDNALARCADCNHTVEHRPQLPSTWLKLCAICALKRTNN
jgi:hypothetical protein